MSKHLTGFTKPRGAVVPAATKRRAPRASEEAAHAFVGKDEARESRYRREGPGERIGAYLPPELVQEFKLAALTQRRSLSDALTEAVREWLTKGRNGTT